MEVFKFGLLTLLILIISCGPEKNESRLNFYSEESIDSSLGFQLVRTITLGDSESPNIGAPLYNIEFDNKDRMYFFDTIESKFIVYDSSGKYLSSFGRSGRGPKEFELVYAYTLDDENNLFVYDDTQRLIKVFNEEFELSNTIEVNNNKHFISSHDLIAYKDNLYFGIVEASVASARMAPELLTQSPAIYKLSLSYEEDSYFGNYDPYLANIKSRYNRPLFVIDSDSNTIFMSHQNSYRIQVFDLNTYDRLAYFGVLTKNFGEGLKETNRNNIRRENYLETIDESTTDLIFVTDKYAGISYINGTESWFDSKDLSDLNYFISIYDKNSKALVKELQSPNRLIKVHKNQFYFIENEDPSNFKIGVYELERS